MRRMVTGWAPQSTTRFDEPEPEPRARMARGSGPPSGVSDTGPTALRVRPVAMFDPEPVVRIALELPATAELRVRVRRRLDPVPLVFALALVTMLALLACVVLAL